MIRPYVELIRLPAVVTVPGDALAGGGRTVLPSVLLYWAGMALNDYADRDLDAVERPERPIPSGRLSPTRVLIVSSALMVAGVGCAVAAGRARAGLGVAGAVVIYDVWAKNNRAGSLVMASARSLDVLLGAGSSPDRGSSLAAAGIGAHTFGVTTLSRGEVSGGTRGSAVCQIVSVVAAAAFALLGIRQRPRGPIPRGLAGVLLAGYVVDAGRAGVQACRTPDADTVRRSTRSSLLSITLLQAALCVESNPAGALALVLSPRLVPLLARSIAVT